MSKTGNWEYHVINEELTASDEAYKIFGIRKDADMPSLDAIIKHVDGEELLNLQKAYYDFKDKGARFDTEFRYLHPVENKVVHLNAKAELIVNDQGKAIRIIGTIQDISERKEMEKRIFEAIIETEEKERQRMAQDLHDEIGPLLSSLKLYVSSFSDKLSGDEKARFIYSKIQEIVSDAVENVRELSYALSPNILINFGLYRAIQNIIDRNSILIPFDFVSNIEAFRFNRNVEIIYYRIIKELVNNTLKHAGASMIKIRVHYMDNTLTLEYMDDGKGFDINSELSQKREGIGLFNIISRVKLINANYHFDGGIGKGFIFELRATTDIIS